MGSITRPASLTPEIRQSWERCLEAGLDPHRPPEPVYADAATVREARERHELTRRLALAEMHNLYHQISGSNFMIALGDPAGMVLDTITDDTFRTTAEAKNIRAGGLWGELQQGTNALGLASAMKAPVTVHGPEHFFRMYDGLTCNAAPIFGPSGEIAGVLDASSDCRSRQRHTMALVKMSVRQIENGLFRDLHRNDLVLIFHTRAEYLRTLSAGLLAVDPSGTILAASAQAAFFLQGLPARPGHHFAELFRTGFLEFLDESHRRDRVRLEDHEGSSYVVTIDNLHQACPLHRHPEPNPKPHATAPLPRFHRRRSRRNRPARPSRRRDGPRRPDPDPRPHRNRQGTDGPPRPRRQRPDRRFRPGKLCGPARHPDRSRTVRLRRGRLHRSAARRRQRAGE